MSQFDERIVSAAKERLDGIAPLVDRVGLRLIEMQNEELETRTKGSNIDLVTRADYYSEEQLVNWIIQSYSEDSILAEEGGRTESKNGANSWCWCIDPLDGTINYAHGLPLYAISVGLLYNEEVIGGIVLLPGQNELYRAIYGGGATLNGDPIAVSETNSLAEALIVTGFPYNRREIINELLAGVEAILMRGRGLRRTGSAALDLCWLAAGRFDALYELNLNAWDTAGGVIIAREAGVKVSDLKGNDYRVSEKSIIASSSRIHGELQEMVAEALAGFKL